MRWRVQDSNSSSHLPNDDGLDLAVMASMNQPCIPSDLDISGIGVRAAIYTQNMLSFISVIVALWDGSVRNGLKPRPVETQATAVLITLRIRNPRCIELCRVPDTSFPKPQKHAQGRRRDLRPTSEVVCT
ncbi:hypothetical protein K474DRAFT_1345330 [Panus rudis PR-1116 ss-1]|nr:hypothetical protein K474DRAFT_1345330 [Panus rudis PR-1116 ss-1]